MAAGGDANCAAIHTSEIFPTVQVTSYHRRVRGYERVLVGTALLVTFGISGFAATGRGDEVLAQYSDTPTLHHSARPDSRTRTTTRTKGTVTAGPIGILGIP